MSIQRRFSRMHRSKGLVALISVIAAPFLILAIGFAVDSGRAYLVKAKLYAAVDAAGIAAARAVANGETAAKAAAKKYFEANIPDGFHGSVSVSPLLSFAYDAYGNITIDLSATAEMDSLFLGAFGHSSLNLGATAQTIRRPVDIVLVIDNSGSLSRPVDVTDYVQQRSIDFISNFNTSFDRISLIGFGTGAKEFISFQSTRGHDRADIEEAIEDEFTFNGYTNSAEGMYLALNALKTVDSPANLKVIVFFTDGAPNTFSSRFRISGLEKNNYKGSISSGDSTSGTPYGLWKYKQLHESHGSAYVGYHIEDDLQYLPDYYTAHNKDATAYKVLNPDHPTRPVTQFNPNIHSSNDLYKRVNRIARNLVEEIAYAARDDEIYVFTLGLGSSLTSYTGPDSEKGEDLLLRMANDPRMLAYPTLKDDFEVDQQQGVYCHAVDKEALGPCFDEMLDVIIRLTM